MEEEAFHPRQRPTPIGVPRQQTRPTDPSVFDVLDINEDRAMTNNVTRVFGLVVVASLGLLARDASGGPTPTLLATDPILALLPNGGDEFSAAFVPACIVPGLAHRPIGEVVCPSAQGAVVILTRFGGQVDYAARAAT